jgi:hypothetical protein
MASDYNTANYNVKTLLDHQIVKDVLVHLRKIIDQCRLKKLTKQRGVAKLTYGVAKAFGKRSAFYDRVLWHPSMETRGTDQYIRIADLRQEYPGLPVPRIYYRLLLCGKESKTENRLGGNAFSPNEIIVNATDQFRCFTVDMELSGPALLKLLADHGCNSNVRGGFGDKVRRMIEGCWGSIGVRYGNFNDEHGNESYNYVRQVAGIVSRLEEGRNWVYKGPSLPNIS